MRSSPTVVIILSGTIGFVLLPTLAFVGVMSVSDNALNESIDQSAKETLYPPRRARSILHDWESHEGEKRDASGHCS